MMMKRTVMVILSLVLCISLLSGCGGNQAVSDTGQTASSEQANKGAQAPVSGEPDKEQYLNTYISADPTSFDVSLRSDSYSSTMIINTMEGLIRTIEVDGEYVTSPGDAQTWESTEDGLVWTFHLGDNKWTDGEAVTADQYVYSLKRSADPAVGCPNGWFLSPVLNYEAISNGEMSVDELGVKALDEKTLQITLSAVTPAFLKMCDATIYYPQRQDKVEAFGEKYGSDVQYIISNGPFYLDSWTRNSALVLKKNPNYWDKDSVKLETINFAVMSETSTITSAYESGEIDEVSVAYQEWVDKFTAREDSKYQKTVNNSILFSFYNTKDALFQNANIRKAFTLAIDREDANIMCYSGLRLPTYGWVVPTISVGDTNFREKAGDPIKEMIDDLKAEGKTPKDLLLEGMKELGLGDDPSTLNVTFSLGGTTEWFKTLGDYLQQTYKAEMGLDVNITFNDWSLFYNNVETGNYQMGYMSWGAYYDDPYDVLSIFKSEYDQVSTGWANAEYDELIDNAGIELDADKRLQYYMDAEKILIKEACVVSPMQTSTTNGFFRKFVYGFNTLGFSNAGYKYVYTSGRK
ncbi:peptide ABC transporter substrate-binding protein [Fusibacter sp. 3D3]|uniref:peptide ABC transporter substrate-binding protein n=1 Tax=Fusibacter sp. 3D3 TaxID=1048380 RepID=UPI000852B434|nr:ABC transporter substrate-binding protein [Fusibacter sp. 3D3]GAU79242.1 oligopeptide ABC transporter periplasmic oligopeptide-binding protein OppA [Fusibacter sp. 3D3]